MPRVERCQISDWRAEPAQYADQEKEIDVNKSILVGTLLGAVAVTATGTMASYSLLNKSPEYAEVVKVQPVTETISIPRQQCRQVAITHKTPEKDPNQVTGSVIGAVVGGVLGNQVGGGNGKKLATLAGAAAGVFTGNKVQQNLQANNTYTTTEQRCTTVTDTEEKVIGYDVEYQLEDQVATVRMEQHPGERIPVEDGQLVLSQTPVVQAAN